LTSCQNKASEALSTYQHRRSPLGPQKKIRFSLGEEGTRGWVNLADRYRLSPPQLNCDRLFSDRRSVIHQSHAVTGFFAWVAISILHGLVTLPLPAVEGVSKLPQPMTVQKYWGLPDPGNESLIIFTGQSLYFDPVWRMMFFQDQQGKLIYATVPSTNLFLPTGQWVELIGKTTANTPDISEVRDLGRFEAIRPKSIGGSQLFENPSSFSLVKVSGLIRSIEEDSGKLVVVLASEGTRISARICNFSNTNTADWKFHYATITGVVGSPAQNKTTVPTMEFWSQTLDQLKVIEAKTSPIADRKIVELSGLKKTHNFSDRPVRLSGKVKQKLLNDFFILDDGTGEIQVKSASKNTLVFPEDVVEVIGFIDTIASKPVAQDCQVLIKLSKVESQKITSPTTSDDVLTTIEEIRRRSRNEPSFSHKVLISGVVTYYDPGTSKMFVQDDTGGIYLEAIPEKDARDNFKVGHSVKIEGLSSPGTINPILLNPKIQITGIGTIPTPNPRAILALMSGIDDAENVAVEGVVTKVAIAENHLLLELSHYGIPFSAQILLGNSTNVPPLIDAAVRLEGVSTGKLNQRGEIYSVLILGRTLGDLTILETPSDKPFSLPLREISQILQFDPVRQPGHRVHIQGRVTYAIPGKDLFIQDSSGAIRIRPGPNDIFQRGDAVQVVGFPKGLRSQPILEDVVIRKVGHEMKPASAAIPLQVILSQDTDVKTFHGLFLTAEGTLLESSRNVVGNRMVLQNEAVIFDVILPLWTHDLVKIYPIGSKLKASGICLIDENIENQARTLRLLVQDLGDLSITEAAPWWNLRKFIVAISLGFSLFAAISGWVFLLRRRVRHQTATILRHLEIQKALARLATALSKAESYRALDQLALDFLREILNPQSALIANCYKAELLPASPNSSALGELNLSSLQPILKQAADTRAQVHISHADSESEVATPVFVESALVAVIFVRFETRIREPLADQLTLLQTLAHQYAESFNRISSSIALGQSYQQFSKIFHAAPVGISLIDIETASYLEVNSAFSSLVGVPNLTIVGESCLKLPWQDRDQWESFFQEAISAGSVRGRELKVLVNEDICRTLSVSADTLTINERSCVLAFHFDVTEERRLEAQLLHSQRMESIGTLASGVAHDLNNVLAPILMASELLRNKNGKPNPVFLDLIRDNVTRGAGLINQVLGFARGFGSHRVELNLNGVITEVSRIVRETFPKSILFEVSIEEGLYPISADPVQIHQVLLNLLVNARDAMPSGGKLVIKAFKSVQKDPRSHSKIPSKACVRIDIMDTGNGIPPSIQNKIFDPFFTTKEPGKGTGLGLSTTQTIVLKHSGTLEFVSEIGKGTTFTVLFPAISIRETKTLSTPLSARAPLGEGELILLIDDEGAIRTVMKEALEFGGYKAITAANGKEGIALYEKHREEIAMVITDMAMPEMDGPQTIAILRRIHSSVKILLMSGHDTGKDLTETNLKPNGFLQKPFSPPTLLHAVRNILSCAEPGIEGVTIGHARPQVEKLIKDPGAA